jgi:t-SNARE complex subunit (syntaxin)
MTEPEVVALVKEWKDEMKGVVADYNQLLGKLDAAVTLVNDSEKKWWVVHKNLVTLFVTVVTVLVFIVGIGITMQYTNLCVVNVNGNAKIANIASCRN